MPDPSSGGSWLRDPGDGSLSLLEGPIPPGPPSPWYSYWSEALSDSTEVMCEAYGVSPGAAAAVNTDLINTVLALAEAAGGGTVSLTKPGVYAVTTQADRLPTGGQAAAVLVMGSKTTLYLGAGVELMLASGVNTSQAANNHVLTNSNWTSGNDRCNVRGPGKINGNRAGNAAGYYCGIYLVKCTDGTIDKVVVAGAERATAVDDAYGECIQLNGCERYTVNNNHVSDCAKDGIKLTRGSNYNTVVGNVAVACGAAGVQIYKGVAGAVVSSFNTVAGNVVDGGGVTPAYDRQAGVRVHGGTFNTIAGNHCKAVNTGLELLDGSDNNVFESNHCVLGDTQNGNAARGIYFRDYNSTSCNLNVFIGNVIEPAGNNTSGTYISCNRASTNYFLSNVFLPGVWSGVKAGFFADANSNNNRLMGNSWPGYTPTWTDSGSGNIEHSFSAGNFSVNYKMGTATNMNGGLLIGNAAVVPNVNPAAGGALYCEAGALKYRGSSGTVTTLGPA